MDQKQFRLKDNWKQVLGSREIAKWMNSVAGLINGMTVVRGGNLLIKEGAIEFRLNGGDGGGGDSQTVPLTIYQIDDTHIGVIPGNVTAIYATSGTTALVPTLGGTSLDNDPPPSAAVTLGSTNYIYVKATLSPGPVGSLIKFQYLAAEPMTIELHTSTQSDSGESYDDVAGIAWLYLGRVTTDGTKILDVFPTWTGGNAAYAWTNMGHFWGRS